MRRIPPPLAVLVPLLAFARVLPAQMVTVDYHKADLIRTSGAFVLNAGVAPVWFQDSTRFYYRSTSPKGETIVYVVDPVRRTRVPLFDNVRLATSMSLAGDTIFDPTKVPQTFRLTDDEKSIRWAIGKRRFECTLAHYDCNVTDTAKIDSPDTPVWAVLSPDKKWEAFVHNYNIYVRRANQLEHKRKTVDTTSSSGRGGRGAGRGNARLDSLTLPDSSIQLTTDGINEYAYGINQTGAMPPDRPTRQRPQLIWSPDSKKIAVIRIDERNVRKYPLYSSTRNQPRYVLYPYAAPGDTILVRYDSYVLDIETRTSVRILDEKPPTIVHGMSGLAALKWSRKSDKLYLLDALRGAKRVTMLVADLKTGQTTPITKDSMATYVELVHGGTAGNWEVATNGDDIFFPSEKDGWLHIYRYDATGKLKNQVESGPYAVERIAYVSDSTKRLFFTAWGKEPGVPYYAHLYRIGFDGSAPTLLTPEDGNHTVRFVPTGGYFIDTYSRVDLPPVTTLRSATDGSILMTLERADIDLLRSIGWTPAEVFTVKARDNMTTLYGLIYKPSNFDPRKKYPIISHIYPGPQVGSVGDWGFTTGSSGQARSMAELGFIVIQLDHMGTPKRSKAFHDFYYGNMGDNGIPDHIAAIRQLAARYDYIDINKVGIYGFSGGGFASTDAILRYPDFFKVAVSGSGNHDNRTYGFFWGEKYQGLYQATGASDNFEAAANYTLAKNLKGKLLLTTGDMDNNVHPSNTIRVVDALIKANKDFDMLVIPDVGHALPAYGVRKVWDYFVRNLLGAEPPAGYEMIGGPGLPQTIVAGPDDPDDPPDDPIRP
jgi:dipeptidyl aminopeptidase/acylaminoacyl peptidase